MAYLTLESFYHFEHAFHISPEEDGFPLESGFWDFFSPLASGMLIRDPNLHFYNLYL